MTRRCIRGAEVLRSASQDSPEPLDIWIEDGRIAALTAPGSPHWEGVEFIEGRGQLAIPGLVNAHTHSQSALLQGTVKGEPLDLFVIRAIARRAPASKDVAYVGALFHSMSMLKRGVTSCIDHLRNGLLPSVEGVSAALKAYRDIGMRAVVAPMYEDRVYLDSLPIDPQALPEEVRRHFGSARRPPPEGYFEVMEALLSRWKDEPRVRLMLGVDGPQRCTPQLLEMTGQFAERHKLGLHTHLLEAKTQHLVEVSEHGGSFVRTLDRYGLANERSSFAHFVWCTPEDVALAAERGVNVVHNPVSNLILGSGILPAARLLEAGVSLALGTDGQSGAAPSVLEAARFASLLSRVSDTDPARWLDPRAAFRLGTEGGARAIGLAGELGVIEPGARADIALLDLGGPAWQPRGEVYTHLVMFENGASARTVLVDGEVVLREGRCTRIDEAELMREALSIAEGIAQASAGPLAAVERDSGALAALLAEALERPTSLNRFADLR